MVEYKRKTDGSITKDGHTMFPGDVIKDLNRLVFLENMYVEIPTVTNDMKAVCHGEFSFQVERTCSACFYDEPQTDCEVCGGEIQYEERMEVPWDIVKEIYKMMTKVYLKEKVNGQ